MQERFVRNTISTIVCSREEFALKVRRLTALYIELANGSVKLPNAIDGNLEYVVADPQDLKRIIMAIENLATNELV